MTKEQYYTKSAIVKLKAELKELTGTKRRKVANRIREAKSFGDLSENAEYKDAREAQAFVEGRIAEIENILETAKVVDDKCASSSGAVGVGCKVRVVNSKEENKEYSIVSANEVDPLENKISTSSPIGEALMGKKVGDEVVAKVPAGEMKLVIKKIE